MLLCCWYKHRLLVSQHQSACEGGQFPALIVSFFHTSNVKTGLTLLMTCFVLFFSSSRTSWIRSLPRLVDEVCKGSGESAQSQKFITCMIISAVTQQILSVCLEHFTFTGISHMTVCMDFICPSGCVGVFPGFSPGILGMKVLSFWQKKKKQADSKATSLQLYN